MEVKKVTEYPDAPDIESSTYDYATRFAQPIGEWILKQQIDATRDALNKLFPGKLGLSILDVGGGDGQNIQLIGDLGHKLTIIGSDPNCIEIIRDEIAAGKAEFIVSPLLDLPYEDNSFDIVICYRILSHMKSWQALLAELTRVSKQLVLVDYPSLKSLNYFSNALFPIKQRIEKNTRRFNCFREKDIDNEFHRHHFSKHFEYRQVFLPIALYRAIGSIGFAKWSKVIFKSIGLTSQFGSPVIAGYGRDKT